MPLRLASDIHASVIQQNTCMLGKLLVCQQPQPGLDQGQGVQGRKDARPVALSHLSCDLLLRLCLVWSCSRFPSS